MVGLIVARGAGAGNGIFGGRMRASRMAGGVRRSIDLGAYRVTAGFTFSQRMAIPDTGADTRISFCVGRCGKDGLKESTGIPQMTQVIAREYARTK